MDDLTKALGGFGCIWIVFLVVLGFLWILLPLILDAVRLWTKKSHAELVKQTAILQQIEKRLARMDMAVDRPTEQLPMKDLPADMPKGGRSAYVSMVGKTGEAFCLGCRKTDKVENLLFCEETDTYYHKECLQEVEQRQAAIQSDRPLTLDESPAKK
jgi:hypothetical protein